jgi:hypothetical protein
VWLAGFCDGRSAVLPRLYVDQRNSMLIPNPGVTSGASNSGGAAERIRNKIAAAKA